jgi:uncharacterized protein with ATP-grasp and redox domains
MTTPLNLPPYLMTSEPGSFARRTIVERKPQIIAQVLADFDYPPEIVATVEAFRDEIAHEIIQPLRSTGLILCHDVELWNAEIAQYPGKTWLEVPWYFAETLFYRKLLEAVHYFQPGEWQGVDPFQKAKDRQIAADILRAANEWEALDNLPPQEAFEVLIHSCLWGNRTDLSNFTVTRRGPTGLAARDDRHQILIDDTEALYRILSAGIPRLDFINDNCGIDFLTDLALADFVLQNNWAGQMVMHLKPQPFFVSDVMIKDAEAMLLALRNSASNMLASIGERLLYALECGQLAFQTDPFWATPFMFRQMPSGLRTELAQASLVLLKGDVNYRRLLDDRHWPHTARMEEIAHYFPAPFATLRTLKGEIMVGLQPGQAEQIVATDPTWLINGQRGVIQFVNIEGNQ